jgi:hypothetical protein
MINSILNASEVTIISDGLAEQKGSGSRKISFSPPYAAQRRLLLQQLPEKFID